MSEAECTHGELEYLGSQRTEGGENLYYRCKTCHAVLIVTPGGKHVYVIKSRTKG